MSASRCAETLASARTWVVDNVSAMSVPPVQMQGRGVRLGEHRKIDGDPTWIYGEKATIQVDRTQASRRGDVRERDIFGDANDQCAGQISVDSYGFYQRMRLDAVLQLTQIGPHAGRGVDPESLQHVGWL